MFSRDRVSVWEDENLLEMDGGDSHLTLCVRITPRNVHVTVKMFCIFYQKQSKTKNHLPQHSPEASNVKDGPCRGHGAPWTPSFLVMVRNASAALGKGLALPYKTKHTSSPTRQFHLCLPRRNQNVSTKSWEECPGQLFP